MLSQEHLQPLLLASWGKRLQRRRPRAVAQTLMTMAMTAALMLLLQRQARLGGAERPPPPPPLQGATTGGGTA